MKHIIGWLIYAGFLTSVHFNYHDNILPFSRILIILFFHIIAFYLNVNYLIPVFLEKGNWKKYAITVFISLLILVFGIYFFMHLQLVLGLDEEFNNASVVVQNKIKNSRFSGRRMHFMMIMGFISTAAVLFVSTVYKMVENERVKKQKIDDLERIKAEAELKFLKSQINPHFLFNSLNNIYALTLTKSDKAPESVLKMSELLRYMLYDSDKEAVSLAKEIEYLKNYIELQKLKYDQIPSINFDVIGVENQEIAPLIFVPIIENAFKHGDLDNPKGELDIQINVKNSGISFVCSNSIANQRVSKDNTTGIGLVNVRKRLELIYPKKHTFEMNTTNNKFTVDIFIEW